MPVSAKNLLFKIFFYSAIGILLMSFSIVTLTQGIITQLQGDTWRAFVHYVISLISVVTAYWVYVSGKRQFKMIELF